MIYLTILTILGPSIIIQLKLFREVSPTQDCRRNRSHVTFSNEVRKCMAEVEALQSVVGLTSHKTFNCFGFFPIICCLNIKKNYKNA